MPWKSKKQEKWGNSPAGHKALGDTGVAEFNAASKGKLKGESHSYDHGRPKKKIVSRYAR